MRISPLPRGHRPLSPSNARLDLDRRIAEAVSPEKMKDNPYRGKPLRLEDNPFEGEWALAFRLVRSAGHRLPWMDLQEEIQLRLHRLEEAIEAHLEWLRHRLDQLTAQGAGAADKDAVHRVHDTFLRRIAQEVAELRKKILDFNLMVPLPDRQVHNVRVEDYLQRIGHRADALLAAVQALPEPRPPAAAQPHAGGLIWTVAAGVVIAALALAAAWLSG